VTRSWAAASGHQTESRSSCIQACFYHAADTGLASGVSNEPSVPAKSAVVVGFFAKPKLRFIRRLLMRRAFLPLLLGASVVHGCTEAKSPPPPPATPQPPAPTPSAKPEVTEAPRSTQDALLAWLDPDAVTVLYGTPPETLDLDAVAVLFALPPKLARMLRELRLSETGLQAVLPVDAPAPATWFEPELLATHPRLSSETYLVRRLRRPRAEIEPLLEGAGFHAETSEGFTVHTHRGAFPWKLAFLEPDILAYIPVRALGSGLLPLTAARDLPASEVEGQLRTAGASSAQVVLQLFAAGPLLHLDLGDDVAQVMFAARRWERGLDVQVQLVPTGDLENAARALGERDLGLETDQVRAIAARVAYTVEGPTVLGRLQLTASDLASLQRPP